MILVLINHINTSSNRMGNLVYTSLHLILLCQRLVQSQAVSEKKIVHLVDLASATVVVDIVFVMFLTSTLHNLICRLMYKTDK